MRVGQQAQADPGNWIGNPVAFTYQWQVSSNGTTGWADISGETRSDYIVGSEAEGDYVRVGVIAINVVGVSSEVAYSEPFGPIDGVLGVPELSVAPAITGDAISGETLTCNTGEWTNTPTLFAYLWQTSPSGGVWTDVGTGSTLLLSGFNDLLVRCQVIATNTSGASAPAYSSNAGPVAHADVEVSPLVYGVAVVDGKPVLVQCRLN